MFFFFLFLFFFCRTYIRFSEAKKNKKKHPRRRRRVAALRGMESRGNGRGKKKRKKHYPQDSETRVRCVCVCYVGEDEEGSYISPLAFVCARGAHIADGGRVWRRSSARLLPFSRPRELLLPTNERDTRDRGEENGRGVVCGGGRGGGRTSYGCACGSYGPTPLSFF